MLVASIVFTTIDRTEASRQASWSKNMRVGESFGASIDTDDEEKALMVVGVLCGL